MSASATYQHLLHLSTTNLSAPHTLLSELWSLVSMPQPFVVDVVVHVFYVSYKDIREEIINARNSTKSSGKKENPNSTRQLAYIASPLPTPDPLIV
jgi:hypothetical protein